MKPAFTNLNKIFQKRCFYEIIMVSYNHYYEKEVTNLSNVDIYMYGMVLVSTMNLLKGDFPELDTYGEIKQSFILPGGETGAGSMVLSSLGCSVRLAGNYQGPKTMPVLKEFLEERYGVDLSRLYYDDTFEGVRDMILIDAHTRTCFGTFQAYFSDKIKRWSQPLKSDIEDCSVVGLDPFFMEQSEQVAILCKELGKKYVTIDCKPESIIHKYSEVNIISNEFIQNNYKGQDVKALHKRYTEASNGLVIFTFGGREILFGRQGEPIRSFKPYEVKVESTLGAGDTFKAGAVYAVFKGMSDEDIVSFAAATAGIVCSKFPLALNPPTLEKINNLITSRK